MNRLTLWPGGKPLAFRLLHGLPNVRICRCSMSVKSLKGFGRDARIEGDIKDGQRILLVEDLTTDGGSKLNFVEALRTAGAEVAHTFVIFYYDIFTDTPARLAQEGISLHYLSTWWDVLNVGRQTALMLIPLMR